MQKRFVDPQTTLADFCDEVLAVCPRCGKCARIAPVVGETGLFAPRRAVCVACGRAADWAESGLRFVDAADPYFGLPLWLQAPCGGRTLWAYNHRHLNLIERHVGATLRERRRDPETGWSNQCMTNRLPDWMIVAKHRDAVLKTIAEIRSR